MPGHAPPLHLLTPELTHLPRFAEFHRPLPVDRVVRSRGGAKVDTSRDIPPELLGGIMGPQARAHLGVLDYHRGDFELAAYERGEWAVVKTQFRSLAMRALLWRVSTSTQDDFTYADDGGTNRTMRPHNAANSNNFTDEGTNTNDQQKFKYGSNGGAEPGTSNNILTQLGADIIAGNLAYDDVNFRVNVSGSRIHTEAAATIREIADFQRWRNTDSVNRFFMQDRTVIADTAVATNQTVAVSYQWQF